MQEIRWCMGPSSSDGDETKDRLAAEMHLGGEGMCKDDSKQDFPLSTC